jgi:hypothetical protein
MGDIGHDDPPGSNAHLLPSISRYSHRISIKMTGSNLFSFASTKRKPKPMKDNISDPLSVAEIRYMEARAADDASTSPRSVRIRRTEQRPSSRPSIASVNTYDAESQRSFTASFGREDRQNSSGKPDRAAGGRTGADLHRNKLKKEQSSSTLRSYYDRKKLPLAVSQQTSASSARDFALRKGCPSVIPNLQADLSCPCPLKAGIISLTSKKANKKRPTHLDFSMLFPKPLPRSGPLLSPQRYTNSPPPLSATSEVPFQEVHSQPLLCDSERREGGERATPAPDQCLRLPIVTEGSSLAKTNQQKPRMGVHNWFDGLEGDLSDDGANREPDMQPDFVETAFRTAPDRLESKTEPSPKPEPEPEKYGWPHNGADRQSSVGRKSPISPNVEVVHKSHVREALHKWEVNAKSAKGGKWSTRGQPRRNTSMALDQADLHEESMLCLSSSDEDEGNTRKEDQRQVLEQRGPFLRDSIGVESIDSDIEIGTAQAVNTSFLRTSKPLAQSSSIRGNSLIRTRSKAQRLKAVDIPDRHSSRQGIPLNEHNFMSANSNAGVLRASSGDQDDQESLSSKRSARTASTRAQTQSPLIMALTPQEASLLEAMRSKRASMRQIMLTEAYHNVVDENGSSRSSSMAQRSLAQPIPKPLENRVARLEADSREVKKSCPANATSTEPSLPSGRVSLIFSESLSSPTTGRDSPATPTLDSMQDLNVLHALGDANRFGDARCRTGSNQVIVLDNFQQSQRGREEYPWLFGQFTERADSAMIH